MYNGGKLQYLFRKFSKNIRLPKEEEFLIFKNNLGTTIFREEYFITNCNTNWYIVTFLSFNARAMSNNCGFQNLAFGFFWEHNPTFGFSFSFETLHKHTIKKWYEFFESTASHRTRSRR